MPTPTKLLPDQYETIEGDLIYKEGVTRYLRINQAASGPGNLLVVEGGPAAAGSNQSGGDAFLAGAAGDGSGKTGRSGTQAPFILNKVNPTTFVPRGANQTMLYAGDDTGNTELFVDTPLGIVQVTKGGALDVTAAPAPAVVASAYNDVMTPIVGGPPPPNPVLVGNFAALSFPAGTTTVARSQIVVPQDFRDALPDNVQVVLRYTIGAGGINNIVRLQTSGSADASVIPTTIYNLDVSAVTPGTIVQSPPILALSSSLVSALSTLSVALQRTTFVGEFSADIQIVSVVYLYNSQVITSAVSVSNDEFAPVTGFTPPGPGTMGAYLTNDYPPGSVTSSAVQFVVPQQYLAGNDCLVELTYGMSTAQVGGRVDLIVSGSINNVTPIPPTSVSVYPSAVANQITRTGALINIGSLVNPLDNVVVIVQRTATDTHLGAFRVTESMLVMAAAVVFPGTGAPEASLPFVDVIAGNGPPDVDTTTVLGTENEVYRTATGTNTNQDVTFVARGQVPVNALGGIASISVVTKVSAAVGNNQVIVSIRRASGAVIFTSAPLVSATRLASVFSGFGFASQPAPGERFLVLCQAIVDSGATTFVGAEVAVIFS